MCVCGRGKVVDDGRICYECRRERALKDGVPVVVNDLVVDGLKPGDEDYVEVIDSQVSSQDSRSQNKPASSMPRRKGSSKPQAFTTDEERGTKLVPFDSL